MDIFDPKQLALLQIDPEENASLQTLLTKHNLPLLELLSIKNIQPKIRSNFTYFIKHCQKNQDFCFNLIDIGIKCPMHEGASDTMKQACYIAADALTCDQDVVADLLILSDKSKAKKNDSDNQSEQFEQIEENIETQVNDSVGPQQVQVLEEPLSEQQKFTKKYKYLMRILDYIAQKQTKNLDQNCINYMIKSLNCLVRKKATQFLEFLHKKPQVLKRLIELNNFSSISQFLIKILSDDEIQGEHAQTIKKIIIEGALKRLLENVKQQDFAQRLDFLEQLFQTNKYASEDDRTQLQKMSDIFASKDTIQFFYQHLLKPNTPTEFSNSISYIYSIVKRMNVDQEVDPYSYSNEPKQETMVFDIDILFKQFPNILRQGSINLANLKYPEPYKQKLVETKFFELLVLLTKNSRFTNCSLDKPKMKLSNSILKGNNIILSNQQQKIRILKQLLTQFANQTKNGINRICLIALIQKVLTLQIYQTLNHPQKTINGQQTDKAEAKTQTKTSQTENKTQNTLNNSAQKKQQQNSSQQEELPDDGGDKKMKINKIKAGLKLNIKKFSLETNEPAQKVQQKNYVLAKKPEATEILRKRQSSLKKEEVLQIFQYFSEIIKRHPELTAPQTQKKQKNHETQVGALINKILMIFSNSIEWSQQSEDTVTAEKQKFISAVDALFPYFNFEEICKNYSVTLATTKHPNASAKEKTNPQLTFTTQFFKTYLKKKQLGPQRSNQNDNKNLELSDSDFKSDQEEIHAVKCSIQDFKKFTGFKLQSKPPADTNQPIQSNLPQIPQKEQASQRTQTPHKEIAQEATKKQKHVNQQKTQIPKQIPSENTKLQQKPIGLQQQPQKKKPTEDKKAKEDVIRDQKIPFQFYIKHRMILV